MKNRKLSTADYFLSVQEFSIFRAQDASNKKNYTYKSLYIFNRFHLTLNGNSLFFLSHCVLLSFIFVNEDSCPLYSTFVQTFRDVNRFWTSIVVQNNQIKVSLLKLNKIKTTVPNIPRLEIFWNKPWDFSFGKIKQSKVK